MSEAASSTDQWFVVWSNPNCDERAVASIEGLGFEARVLRWRKQRIHNRTKQKTWQVRRLLPRYVFVRLPSASAVGRVRGCDGVQNVLNANGRPLTLSSRDMTNLTALEAIDEFDEPEVGERPAFEIGSVVRVVSGPLKEREAIVVAKHGRREVSVIVDFLVSFRPVRVSTMALRPASDKMPRHP